ncbi:MAG: hypothetical protein AAF533_21190 [Acidobacteriota bacterium]
MRGPFFVDGLEVGAVGTCPKPPGGAELRLALEELALQADILVSLLGPREIHDAGLEQEGRIAAELGMEYFEHPIGDLRVPTDEQALIDLAARIADKVRGGKRLVAHCWMGIGRATLLAGSVLVHLGWSGEQAIEAISSVRGVRVPDNATQRDWLLSLPARLQR